jgi:prepilin-type N-terminal cleavage/methylation domain-containing protein
MGKRNAFTLVELLVVIAVIAVLMGILLPALGRAREQAKKSVCLGNQRQIMLATGIYQADNDGKIMYQHAGGAYWALPNALTTQVSGAKKNWISRIWPSVGENKDIFQCPSNKSRTDPGELFCPNEKETFSYVLNGILTHFGSLNVRPSMMILMSDDFATSNGAILRPHFQGATPSLREEKWVGWMRSNDATELFTAWPHKGRNHGYLDGHAEWNAEWDITSGKYGLWIGGEDKYEPELSGYDNPSRWGQVMPSLVR